MFEGKTSEERAVMGVLFKSIFYIKLGCFSLWMLTGAAYGKASLKVIAHRGASGSLPEHSLASKALAFGLGADYLEQDLVATKDHKLIVMHNTYLECTSDVALIFPARKRKDGHYYALDFTLQEIRRLRAQEPVKCQGSDGEYSKPKYEQRYRGGEARFFISEFKEEYEMLIELNRMHKKNVGFQIEIKDSKWHEENGIDIVDLVLNELKIVNKLRKPSTPVFVQSFSPKDLKRIKATHPELKTVQLIGENDWSSLPEVDYERLKSKTGIEQISMYASAIGPWLTQIAKREKGRLTATPLLKEAQRLGLEVYPYTLRFDSLAEPASSMREWVSFLLKEKVEGIFTDHPGQAIRLIQEKE